MASGGSFVDAGGVVSVRATSMADLVCQVINQDDQMGFIWSARGGFFEPHAVKKAGLTALKSAQERVVHPERLARARLARRIFDQVDGLWRTWPERGKQLLEDEKRFRSSKRDFTWGYYKRLCDQTRVLRGHDSQVVAVAFSRDGRTLAIADSDGTAWLWDPATGENRATIKGHVGQLVAVALSADGTMLARAGREPSKRDTSGVSGELRLFDVMTGVTRATLRGHEGPVYAVAFSHDGTTLASAGEDVTVRRWDATPGAARAPLIAHDLIVYTVAFSRDGTTLASAGRDGTVRLWEAVIPSKSHPPPSARESSDGARNDGQPAGSRN
jgi:WD40 repeat protein